MEEIQTNDDVFQLVDQQIANHYPTEIKIRRHSSKRSHDSNTDDATSLQPIVNAGGFRIHRLANEIRFPALQTAIAYTKGDIPIQEIANATPITTQLSLPNPAQLFKAMSRDQIKAYQRIFLVKKADTNLCRIIGHPQALNQAFTPERLSLVSFLEVPELLREFSSSFYAVELDLKNYFPQIPIQDGLSKYLGTIMNNQSYVQTVLTQGWNGSTFVAQSLTYAFIALCTVRYQSLPSIIFSLSGSLPAYISLPGFLLIVVYDNILIMTNTESAANLWSAAILDTAKHLNLVIKYLRVTHNYALYLGQEYKSVDGKIYWRTLPSKLQKWLNPDVKISLHQALGYIATIIRETQIRTRSLRTITHTIKWLSSLSSLTSNKNWRTLNVTEQFDIILRPALSLLDDSWTHIPKFIPSNPLFIATDATPSTLAWYTRVNGKDVGFSCNTNSSSHINSLEAMAIHIAIEANFTNHDVLFILCDNQTAGLSFVKGYSSNKEISQIVQDRKSGNVPIIIFDVESESNIADFPSRNKSIPENHFSRNKWELFVKTASLLKIIQSKWIHRSSW